MNEQFITPQLNPNYWVSPWWRKDFDRMNKKTPYGSLKNPRTVPTFSNNYNQPNGEGEATGWFGLDGVVHPFPPDTVAPYIDDDGGIWP